MPEPEPRASTGRLFITSARFGEENRPIPTPLRNRITANTGKAKSTGRAMSPANVPAVMSIPLVVNHLVPSLSDNAPDNGAVIRKPIVNGTM